MKWAVYSNFKNESKTHIDLWLLQENKALLMSFEACGEFILLTSINIGVGEAETAQVRTIS